MSQTLLTTGVAELAKMLRTARESWLASKAAIGKALPKESKSCSNPKSYLVHLLNSAIEGHIPILLVHIVVSCPRLIAHPKSKVLHCGGLLLKELHNPLLSIFG